MTSQRMTQYDWLDDLCVRFLINLPKADMMDMQRLCFQAEEAHWFYDDFVRPNDKSMPRMTLREFCLALFKQCPLLCDHPEEQLESAFDDFMKYKPTVPVRGAILLNDTMDEVLLVKGWKKTAHWGFPKGKINLNEDDLDCAIREVDEETGFDIRIAGLVPPRSEALSVSMKTREHDTKLFIFRGVSKSTVFEAKTRKEISDIQWFRIADLPTNKKKPHHHGHETDDPGSNQPSSNRFYLVGPFMTPLRRKIREMRARDAALAAHGSNSLPPPPHLDEAVEEITEDEGAPPQPDYYGYSDINSGYSHEPQQQQQQQQQYADASRDLLSMINRPSPAASQPQNLPMPYADQNAPKASALMAMLQKGGSQSGPQANHSAGNTPHTPVDHAYGQAPQPNTPHHQHYTNQHGQPGPQDPFYQHQGPPPQLSQQVPHVHQTQKAPTPTILHPQPLPPTVQKALFTRDALPSPDVAAYAGGQGHPNMMLPPPPPPPQQQQPQQQQAPLNSHAANLLSFFKTDQQPQAQQPQPQQQPQQGPPTQAFQQQIPAHMLEPAQQPQQSRSPAAVFTEAHHPNGPRAQHSGHHHHQYGTHYTGGGQPSFAGQGVPDTLNKIINGNGNGSSKASNTNGGSSHSNAGPSNPFLPNPQQSQHASSLLSMFKQTSAAPGPDPEAVPASGPAHVHPGMTSQQQTVYSTTTTTTTTAGPISNGRPIQAHEAEVAARARGNAGAVEMNSDVNLPFGALSLLSRPRANESNQSNQHPSTYAVPIAELPAGTTTVTATTILKKQPSFPHQGAAANISGRQVVDSPDHGRPSTHGSGHQYFPPPPELQPQQQQQQQPHGPVRRPSYASSSSVAPTEGGAGYPTTAQQLLQQFQKQPQQPQPPQSRQPSLAGSHAHMPPPGSVSSRGSMDQRTGVPSGLAPPGMVSPENDSGASADGLSGMRRGSSQTPISTEKRDFLLSYLTSRT
ncbi:decapping enzyme [Ophiostoma piceae UAMH 11346]|uniref:Decapping enzyme n=1 Tax=Ophiostoma piceae (strain UAMH 11346) TaxID=1262450 RepID=S3BV49_OPHP1|nr:decapping enzyme [Ophiostoma piceae UAMH 11346]